MSFLSERSHVAVRLELRLYIIGVAHHPESMYGLSDIADILVVTELVKAIIS